jgi:hypothetical protein
MRTVAGLAVVVRRRVRHMYSGSTLSAIGFMLPALVSSVGPFRAAAVGMCLAESAPPGHPWAHHCRPWAPRRAIIGSHLAQASGSDGRQSGPRLPAHWGFPRFDGISTTRRIEVALTFGPHYMNGGLIGYISRGTHAI